MRVLHTTAVFLIGIGSQAVAQQTRTVTDDTGTTVEIPASPERIVTLHDLPLTIPLIELGVLPVGSHGRGKTLEEAFIRASAAITGVDFGNSDIEWMGNHPADIEKIAGVEPDLILTTTWQSADVDQLRSIAPTVVFDSTVRGTYDAYAWLADLTDTKAQHDILKGRYDAQIALMQQVIDTSDITVSTLHVRDGVFFACNPYDNIGKVLIDAGFKRPEAIEAIPSGDCVDVSAEAIQDYDADFIITTYRSSAGVGPDDIKAYGNAILPGWCDALHACRENQLFYFSRAEATATSYTALGQISYSILSALGGRDYVPFSEQ